MYIFVYFFNCLRYTSIMYNYILQFFDDTLPKYITIIQYEFTSILTSKLGL